MSGGAKGAFDASGYERAAKAIREINQSPHAGDALRLAQEQERTKQMQTGQKKSENDAKMWEKRTEFLEGETKEHNKRAEYADELARKRADWEREQRQDDGKKQEAKQEAAAKRIEAMKRQTEARVQAERRATITAENEAKMQSIRATEIAKAEGQMRVERHNEDLTNRRLKLEEEQRRITYTQVAQTSITAVANRIGGFFQDRDSMLKAVVVTSSLFLAFQTSKVSTRVVGNFVAANLGRPSLVRETSKRSYTSAREIYKSITQSSKQTLEDIVLPTEQSTRIASIATGVARAKEFKLPHRHLLLYGPPGTGKTMFGRRLAKESGMDFAILTGGDVSPLGKEAVTEIHKLFDWSNNSRKGIVIFIDEAEAFLRRRDKDMISEDMRSALNAFLYHTGTETNNFMLVLASNQPQLLDSAVLDRVDTSLLFDVPGPKERLAILEKYWADKVEQGVRTQLKRAFAISEEEVPALLAQVADRTAGMSGRQLMQLINAIRIESFVNKGLVSADVLQLTDVKLSEVSATEKFGN